MPEFDDAALEHRLRGVLKEHLGALPLDLTVETLDRRRETRGVGGRFGQRRGLTLLAAAALLLVGGAFAAGSGVLRLPSVVPPAPAPSLSARPPTASPAPSLSARPSSPRAALPEGRHLLYDGKTFGAQIIVNITRPGWYGERGAGMVAKNDNADAPDGARLIAFADTTLLASAQDLHVHADPCHWATTTLGTPVATVDDAVAALAGHLLLDPLAVEVGGHAGKAITIQVPKDVAFSECDGGEVRWLTQGRDRALNVQDPDQTDKLWILDVDGDIVILDAAFFGRTPVKDIDELVSIAQSAQISPP